MAATSIAAEPAVVPSLAVGGFGGAFGAGAGEAVVSGGISDRLLLGPPWQLTKRQIAQMQNLEANAVRIISSSIRLLGFACSNFALILNGPRFVGDRNGTLAPIAKSLGILRPDIHDFQLDRVVTGDQLGR